MYTCGIDSLRLTKSRSLNHETNFESQVQIKDLNELWPQLDAVTKENEYMVVKIKELEGIVAPDDTKKSMATRGDQIARIRLLEQDGMDTLGYGFSTAVEQLKILNPRVELVVEGAGPFNQVVDRKMFYPPDDSSVEDRNGEDEI